MASKLKLLSEEKENIVISAADLDINIKRIEGFNTEIDYKACKEGILNHLENGAGGDFFVNVEEFFLEDTP